MKFALAALCALGFTMGIGNVQAQDDDEPPLTEEQQLLLKSLSELNTTRATVVHVFEYCMKQDDDFALNSQGALDSWKSRNLPYLQLTSTVQEQAITLGMEQYGMTRQELEDLFENSAQDVALEFSRRLDIEDQDMRAQVCGVYAGKIRDGEFDIGRDKPEVKALLDRYREAANL